MPAFTIQSVEPAGTWTPEGGTTLNKFSVGVVDPSTGQPITAQMFYPQGANPPEVGQILNDRILKHSAKGATLKKDPNAQQQTQNDVQTEQRIAQETFGGNQQPMPAQSAPVAANPQGSAPRPDARDQRITRLHSQEMSLRALTIQVNAGMIPADTSKEDFRKSLQGWADWFDADAYGENRNGAAS